MGGVRDKGLRLATKDIRTQLDKEVVISPATVIPAATVQPRKTFVTVLSGFTVLFILLDRTPSWLTSYNRTAALLCSSALVVIAGVLLDMLMFRRTLSSSWRHLGFGRPNARTLIVTLMISALMLGFYPAFSLITGAPFSLPENWWWVLAGLFAIHGIGEEVLFRGFVFHNLRVGRRFEQASFLSLLVFAAAHLYLFTYMPPILAFFAAILALASSYPFAYLFERGNNTIWAPAVLHTLVHAISFFVTSEKFVMTAGVVWMGVWSGLVLLVYAFRGYLFGRSDEVIRDPAL